MSSSDPEILLKKIRKIDSNRKCPNCGAESVLGFQNVCVKFKTFVCDQCKSSHQAISHRVKSITMSSWTMDEVQELSAKRSGGNDAATSLWLAKAPPYGEKYPGGARPKVGDKIEIFKQFIVDCYEKELFKSSDTITSDELPATSVPATVTSKVNPGCQVDLISLSTLTEGESRPVLDGFSEFSSDNSNSNTNIFDFAAFGNSQSASQQPPSQSTVTQRSNIASELSFSSGFEHSSSKVAADPFGLGMLLPTNMGATVSQPSNNLFENTQLSNNYSDRSTSNLGSTRAFENQSLDPFFGQVSATLPAPRTDISGSPFADLHPVGFGGGTVANVYSNGSLPSQMASLRINDYQPPAQSIVGGSSSSMNLMHGNPTAYRFGGGMPPPTAIGALQGQGHGLGMNQYAGYPGNNTLLGGGFVNLSATMQPAAGTNSAIASGGKISRELGSLMDPGLAMASPMGLTPHGNSVGNNMMYSSYGAHQPQKNAAYHVSSNSDPFADICCDILLSKK